MPLKLCLMALITLMSTTAPSARSQTLPVPHIIPYPKYIEPGNGKPYSNSKPVIVAGTKALEPLAFVLADEIARVLNIKANVMVSNSSSTSILLGIDSALREQAYKIEVGEKVSITSGSFPATASGTVTLLQAL